MNLKPLVFNPKIAKDKPENIVHTKSSCPFCSPNELDDILGKNGDCIWLENKYRTLDGTNQTVLIESTDHNGDISNYSLLENRHIFNYVIANWRKMQSDLDYKSVALYKNFGPNSGGSLKHPHMQIVGFKNTDCYSDISFENFAGTESFIQNDVEINISDYPIMGFAEFNVIASNKAIDKLADSTQKIIQYVLRQYYSGRCDSYNLFFYQYGELLITKVVPRFVVSPYFVGYKLSQVSNQERNAQIITELKKDFE